MFFFNKRKNPVLEFQSSLLKEFSLNAVTIENAESRISNIIVAAKAIFDIYFLYIFHPDRDDKHILKFFWSSTPVSSSKDIAVRAMRDTVAADSDFDSIENVPVIHTTAVPSLFLPEFPSDTIDVRSRKFALDELKIKGMVGIGLNKTTLSDEQDIAIDNILTGLINIVVSAKTLAAYKMEIERFATRDPLTNLYNQISFWDLLQYESERSKRQHYRFSLLVLDLDNFKALNDNYGHDVGDLFLKECASILKTAVRAGDIAARYGGDEFTAILPVCDEGQAYIVARRILENLREFSLVTPSGATVKLTASIGVAVYPDHAKQARDLYLLADSMVAQAKTFGKDRISMPSEHDDVELLKSMGEKNIMVLEALSKRKIIPYFQPIMNMKDMKIEAYEVLTRIAMSDRVVSAHEFIETAENMGAIGKLDYQLIEMALCKVSECGYQGSLFLNLSPKTMVVTEFIPTIRTLLKNYHIEPSKMVFEITERDTVKSLNTIQKLVQGLRKEGFRFAVDDFGAGYSSFHYIRLLTIDFIKVDGEFIRNMCGTNTPEKAIVSSIASLASGLGIKTIAEYVETADIFNEVQLAGIDYAQGFYIKKPSADLV